MLPLFLALIFAFQGLSQTLISATAVGAKSEYELISDFALPTAFVKNGAEMFKITYLTKDIHGLPDTASGLISVPDVIASYPLLCYQHGTASDRDNVPSRIGADGYPNGDPISVIFSAFGYITVAPDYLGLGDSRGFHPYVHSETEASAAIDMLFAAREFLASQSSEWNNQLFISGYSQGGHAAAAVHQKLQEEYAGDFTVTAATYMSGPHSISGIMRDLILQNEEYFFAAYIPNTFLSYDMAYDLFDEVEEYFKQPYAATIDSFAREEINLGELNASLISQLIINTGGSFPKLMLQDSILAQATNDNHPLIQALKENDTFNWAPQAPTRLYYCTADDQVPYRNSIVADSIFQINLAPNVESKDVNPAADHGGCVNPAITASLLFFLQFQQIESVATQNLDLIEGLLNVQPNPAADFLEVVWKGDAGVVAVYDTFGREQLRASVRKGEQKFMDISHLSPGMYFLLSNDGKQKSLQKLVVE